MQPGTTLRTASAHRFADGRASRHRSSSVRTRPPRRTVQPADGGSASAEGHSSERPRVTEDESTAGPRGVCGSNWRQAMENQKRWIPRRTVRCVATRRSTRAHRRRRRRTTGTATGPPRHADPPRERRGRHGHHRRGGPPGALPRHPAPTGGHGAGAGRRPARAAGPLRPRSLAPGPPLPGRLCSPCCRPSP